MSGKDNRGGSNADTSKQSDLSKAQNPSQLGKLDPVGTTPGAEPTEGSNAAKAVKDALPKEALPSVLQQGAAGRDPQVESQAAAADLAAKGMAEGLGVNLGEDGVEIPRHGQPTHEMAALDRHGPADIHLMAKGEPSATALAEANNPTLDSLVASTKDGGAVPPGMVRVRVVGPGSVIVGSRFVGAGQTADVSPEDADHFGALIERV